MEEKQKEQNTVQDGYDRVETFEGEAHNYMPIAREMNLMSDKNYMAERVDSQIEWYDRKSSYNQHQYKRMKRLEIIIAASIPVVISFSTMGAIQNAALISHEQLIDGVVKIVPVFTLATLFQVLAAVAGIVLVVFNKLIGLEDYHKNWKEYRLTNEALIREKLLYLTRTEPYDEANAFPLFVEKVEAILNNETQRWRHITKQQSSDLVEKARESLQKQMERQQAHSEMQRTNTQQPPPPAVG